jgi:hypothetical protein
MNGNELRLCQSLARMRGGGGLRRKYSTVSVKLTGAGAVKLGSLLHEADRRQPLHHARVLMANCQHT